MNTWPVDPDAALALPVDELGLLILRDYRRSKGWNAYNWMNDAQQRPGYQNRPDALHALSEAWSWLLSRGLVARDFGQSNSDYVFITRVGEHALDEGLAEVHATERLQVELHPILEAKVRHTYGWATTTPPCSKRSSWSKSEFASSARLPVRSRCVADAARFRCRGAVGDTWLGRG